MCRGGTPSNSSRGLPATTSFSRWSRMAITACRGRRISNGLFAPWPSLVEHDLFGKPVSPSDQVRGRAFPDHALSERAGIYGLFKPSELTIGDHLSRSALITAVK